jgi:hypothetical protein
MVVQPDHFRFDREKQRKLDEITVDQTVIDEQRELVATSQPISRFSQACSRTVSILARN